MNATTVSNISPAEAYSQFAKAEHNTTTALMAWEAVITPEWEAIILSTAGDISKVNGETAIHLGLENNADGVRSAQAVYSVATLAKYERGGATVQELVKALKKGFATNSEKMVERVAHYGKSKSDKLTWGSFISGVALLARPEGTKRSEESLTAQAHRGFMKRMGLYSQDQLREAEAAIAARLA